MTIAVGERAPDFTLAGSDGTDEGRRDYRLSEFRGQPVVLVFYPGDDTPICTKQLNAYTHDIDEFESLKAQVLAISPQSIDSHERFAERQGGFGFPLLTDEERNVGECYGILGPSGFYRRSIFIIDAEGSIRYAHRAVAGLTYRPVSELVEVLAGLD